MTTKKSLPHRRQTNIRKETPGKAPGVRDPKKEPVQREISAGGIVFQKSGNSLVFAVMKDSYGKWTFPKGHVEAGEDIEEAAARETLEELGLEQVRLLDYIGKIDIWFRDKFHKKGQLIHKDIHYYLFQSPMGSVLHPDPEEHVYEAKWVPLSKVERVSSYPDMVPIVKKALELVKELRK
ncbi:NUDIX domain-containing protein [Candidatus Uhrbacteria bacterium]|nr:NUDIX domain-containing protein [Candidatus Uhrbacteria bacterium]